MACTRKATLWRHRVCSKACYCNVIMLLSLIDVDCAAAASNATTMPPATVVPHHPALQRNSNASATGRKVGGQSAKGNIGNNSVDVVSSEIPDSKSISHQSQSLNNTRAGPQTSIQSQHQTPLPANSTVQAFATNSSNTSTAATVIVQGDTSSTNSSTDTVAKINASCSNTASEHSTLPMNQTHSPQQHQAAVNNSGIMQSPSVPLVQQSPNQTQQFVSTPSPAVSPAPPATSSFDVDYSKVRRSGSEISTSVLIYGFSDMEGDGYSMCERAVNNSLGFYARNINYVLTVFAIWGNRTIESYYFKDRSDHTGHLVPVTNDNIARWKAGLTRCFKAGVDAGFTTLHIVLHVNFISKEMHGKSLWRNGVKFDPAERYGPDDNNAFNYSEILLQPAAQALNSVVTNETVLELAIGGEQGLSVFGYPQAYLDMTYQAKALIPNAKSVLTGVSFNYDKVCHCVEPEERDPIIYNNTYPERFLNFRATWGFSRINLTGVKELLAKSDFIGLSSYSPLPANLTHAGIESAIQTAAFEFLYFGIDLKRLIFVGNKRLIFSEQGLGGLTDNARLPPSLDYIRKHPYSGVGPAYSDVLDPWQIAEYRDFRRKLYGMLTSWAAAGGGPQYRIDGIYVWSMGTWDVHAAHPLSLGRNASYGDPVIQYLIRRANAWVNRDYLDEIAKIKPLINGTREYITPPWLRPSPKTISPSTPRSAAAPSRSPAVPAPRLPGQGYCAALKPVTSPDVNVTMEPLQELPNQGPCNSTQSQATGANSTSAMLQVIGDSKLGCIGSSAPVQSQLQDEPGSSVVASPAPVQLQPQNRSDTGVAVSTSPVQLQPQNGSDAGVAASSPPVQSQLQNYSASSTATSPSPVQMQLQLQPQNGSDTGVSAAPSPVQSQPPDEPGSSVAISPSPVQLQLQTGSGTGIAALPTPGQLQPQTEPSPSVAVSSSPGQLQLQDEPSSSTAASSPPVVLQPQNIPGSSGVASSSPVQLQPHNGSDAGVAALPSPGQLQAQNEPSPSVAVSPSLGQLQPQTEPSPSVAVSSSPGQLQLQDEPSSSTAASPAPVVLQPQNIPGSSVVASSSPVQLQPHNGSDAGVAASISPVQLQQQSGPDTGVDVSPSSVQLQQQTEPSSSVAASTSPVQLQQQTELSPSVAVSPSSVQLQPQNEPSPSVAVSSSPVQLQPQNEPSPSAAASPLPVQLQPQNEPSSSTAASPSPSV